ncbi:Cation transporter family protein [Necator americanus]|uniref:Cation transporter family protein n=1 Tax=Necator americanus TaxID=51031 RepID=W2TG30_NECAM|nr:Cation transporter family protein [Necator americanus]ETN81005.1 Cation transporter family protein [Necator americanus]
MYFNSSHVSLASPDEYRLLSDLRHNYDPYERPVANASEPLVVSVKIYLQQILDVDEKNQVITLVAWVEYQWTDYKLKWEPSEYGGIKDIRVPGNANAIWKPDVLLYNSADENFDSTYPVNYVVSHTGHVLQVPPGILKLSCKIDITYFPFDDQMCHLKFGSWTYSGNFIDLRINGPEGMNISEQGMDISYYVENGEWNLLAVPARNETNVFDDQPYPSLYFYLVIQRRTLYYGLNLIIPSLLISLMTVLGFTLPPDAGEKITLALFFENGFILLEITILLSVCFFLSMVADMTPPTSEAVPLIGAFFSCCMLVVSASVVFTVLVLNLHNRKPETHEMSPFLRECLLIWLPWILMMRRPGTTVFNRREIKAKKAEDMVKKTEMRNGRSLEGVMTATDSLSLIRSIRASKNDQQQSFEMDLVPTGHTTNNFNVVQDEQAANDWKFAAMVVDRLCLFIFTIFIVVSTCGIMFSSPHLIA